jgi:GNAT superfamily N-acetyltransferase
VADVQVLSLRDEDVEVAGRVVARAFETDELNVHMYPESAARARLAPMLFTTFVRYDRLFGQVDYLAGFEAVASWTRPGEVETPDRLARAGFDELPEEVDLALLDSVFGYVGPAIEATEPGPHWHLRLLAVEPAAQGRGRGAVLVRHGIERASSTGHAVVLETFSERAMRFYRRNGFEVIVEDVEPTTSLPFWALRHRSVRATSSAPPSVAGSRVSPRL